MGQTISIATRHGRISGWQAKPHTPPRGAVIVEFAFALPVLVLMYTGGVYLSDRVSASRKVTVATRSLVEKQLADFV